MKRKGQRGRKGQYVGGGGREEKGKARRGRGGGEGGMMSGRKEMDGED